MRPASSAEAEENYPREPCGATARQHSDAEDLVAIGAGKVEAWEHPTEQLVDPIMRDRRLEDVAVIVVEERTGRSRDRCPIGLGPLRREYLAVDSVDLNLDAVVLKEDEDRPKDAALFQLRSRQGARLGSNCGELDPADLHGALRSAAAAVSRAFAATSVPFCP